MSNNPVIEPYENEYEQLKIVNIINLDDILQDQKKNEYIKRQENNLIKKHNLYYRKIKKKEKIILSEEFSIDFMKSIHEKWCLIGIQQLQKKISAFYTAKNLR